MIKICQQVWEVYSSDGYSHSTVAYFTKLSDAEKLGKGPYMGISSTSKSLTIFESFEEYEKHKVEELKEQALKKLTAEEKKVLGIE